MRQRRAISIAGRSGDDDIRLNSVRAARIHLRTGEGNDAAKVLNSNAGVLSVQMGNDNDDLEVNETAARRVVLTGGLGTDSLNTDLALEDIYVRGFEPGPSV